MVRVEFDRCYLNNVAKVADILAGIMSCHDQKALFEVYGSEWFWDK